ncbi:MAG: hypothetical protein NWF04_08105 [Candidatus Bathyarchaeota archaeon]|nr:hypothetical protein [Candidatus Bathyarchaeota archaeon]
MNKIFSILLLLILLANAALSGSDSWTTLSPLPSPWQSVNTAVVNGKIYAIGDYVNNSDGSYMLINYEYDPKADNWQTKTPTPLSRYGASLLVYEDKIYFVGGFSGEGTNPPSALVYDPATDAWATKASMSTTRMNPYATVVDGEIYVIGGHTTNPWATDALPFVENEVYDITTDSWRLAASIPLAVSGGFSEVLDGKIYVFGKTNQTALTVQVYDPQTDTWLQGSNPPILVTKFSWVILNGKFFLIGGADKTPYPTTVFDAVQVYDPQTDSWNQGAPMPTGVFDATTGTTTQTATPTYIYLFGGCTTTNYSRTNITQVYDPKTDTWTTGVPMPITRWSYAIENVNDTFYLLGGVNQTTTNITLNQKYTPLGYAKVASPSLNPFVTAAAIILTVILVVVALLVFVRKRKKL